MQYIYETHYIYDVNAQTYECHKSLYFLVVYSMTTHTQPECQNQKLKTLLHHQIHSAI